MKKIIITLIIIVIVVLVGWWFYSSRSAGPNGQQNGIFSIFFPSSGEKNIQNLPGPATTTPGGAVSNGKLIEAGNLIQLTANAITGAAAASSTIRYLEKSTGNIYEINPDGTGRLRLTNTTILKTAAALWSSNADKSIVSFFDENNNLKTFSLNLSTSTGIFLPQSLVAATVSPAEDKIFYLASANSAFSGIIADFSNKNQKNIFTSPFGEFNLAWPNKNTITLLTKPSANVPGFFYSLNPSSGAFQKILGDLNGLTALLSPDGTRAIYSESGNSSLQTKIFNLKDKTTSDFDLRTLPEKCVWSKLNKDIVYCAVPDNFPAGDYPDDWYQGLVSLNDSLWQKDFSSGKTSVLANNLNADVTNPFLTSDENYFVFTNKIDNALWSLKLR